MAYSRADLLTALQAEVQSRPTVAAYYQAGDPRLIAQMAAAATMLSMISTQVDTESMEPFQKTRDTTVLADATMKGILPFARPPRMTLTCVSTATNPVTLVVGRQFQDQYGALYVVEVGATVPAGGTATITVKQMTTRSFTHTVSGSEPFYAIQIPANDDDTQNISGLYVSIAGVTYPYTTEFANLAADQAGFDIHTDEQRRLFVAFGWDGVFGVQPADGTAIDIDIEETQGASTLTAGAVFTLEATATADDRLLTFSLASMVYIGADPVAIDTLREWATYPSTYDSSAVYLGNFDFLIRRNLPAMRFLSVWNEQVEENARGANVANINRLFISAVMDDVDSTWLWSQITQIVAAADDSYWPKAIAAVEVALPLTIEAQVSVVHDVGTVQAQIIAAVLALYGRDAVATKQGFLSLNSKKIRASLDAITALQDDGSDYQITIPAQTTPLPEQYRYVSAASLTVTVTQSTYNDGMWSH